MTSDENGERDDFVLMRARLPALLACFRFGMSPISGKCVLDWMIVRMACQQLQVMV